MKNTYFSKTYMRLVINNGRATSEDSYTKSSWDKLFVPDVSRKLLTVMIMTFVLLTVSSLIADAAPRNVSHFSDPATASNAPIQSTLNRTKIYEKAGHQLEAVAKFSIQAKVLSAAQYNKGREAKISPIDLALGWSKMASNKLLSQVSVTQSGRFASMRFDPTEDIAVNDIVHNSSNMHMIPSSRKVHAALKSVKKGQVVQIEGYLVNIRHSDGWRWLTSTSRTDRGNGACEILLVKSITVVE